MIQCVITGCALVLGTEWVAGDLFDGGECWVFNGNAKSFTTKSGRHLLVPDQRPLDRSGIGGDGCFYTKRLEPRDWWENRGVFVIKKSEANLNQAAKDYING